MAPLCSKESDSDTTGLPVRPPLLLHRPSRRLARITGRRCRLILMALLSPAVSRNNAQATSASRMVVRYEAPANCPSRDDFESALSARAHRVAPAGGLADVRLVSALSVRIHAVGDRFVGQLRYDFGDGHPQERIIDDTHCEALTEALALVAVIELFPTASPAADPVAPTVPSAATNQQDPRARREAAVQPTQEPRYVWVVQAAAGLNTAQTPSVLSTAGLHAGLWRRNSAWRLGATLQYGQSGLEQFTYGSGRFHWFAARLFGCPWSLRAGRFTCSSCATTELALLRAVPYDVGHPTAQNSSWFAPGLGVLGTFQHHLWIFELYAGAAVPLWRYEFYVEGVRPDVMHQPRRIGLASELRAGVAF